MSSRGGATSSVRNRCTGVRLHIAPWWAIFNQMVEYPSTLDGTYAALSHPVRRDLLDRLSDGPMRVTELAEPFGISLAAISKHVGVLERADLVHRRIQGRDHVISLQPGPLMTARDWIDTYRPFWESRIDALETQLRNRRRP